LTRHQIAQRGQIPHVEGRIIQQLLRQRALGPVRPLPVLVELHLELLLDQRGEPHPRPAEDLTGEHGVEEALRPKAAQVMQQPQVEIAAVHHEMLRREPRPERLQVDRRQHIQQKHLLADQELHQAQPHPVVEHVVRLRIEGDLGDAVEGLKQRPQLPRLVDQPIGRQPRPGLALDPEQAADRVRQEAGDHRNRAERGRPLRRGRFLNADFSPGAW
jgi:hypothetical protein